MARPRPGANSNDLAVLFFKDIIAETGRSLSVPASSCFFEFLLKLLPCGRVESICGNFNAYLVGIVYIPPGSFLGRVN
jgi:hypothetical protein